MNNASAFIIPTVMSTSSDSIKKLARQIKANPDDSFSKFALALEFLKRDELDRAKILFENVYQKDPDYVGIYYHLGKLNERLERLKEAKQIYQQGIGIAEKQKEFRTEKELKEALAQLNIEIENQ